MVNVADGSMLSKKGLRSRAEAAGESAMMGRQDRDQRQLFCEFSLDEMIPRNHLLRRINVFTTAVLADLHAQLKALYSDIGRPSVDPESMIRMLWSVTATAFVMSAGCVKKRLEDICSSWLLLPVYCEARARLSPGKTPRPLAGVQVKQARIEFCGGQLGSRI